MTACFLGEGSTRPHVEREGTAGGVTCRRSSVEGAVMKRRKSVLWRSCLLDSTQELLFRRPPPDRWFLMTEPLTGGRCVRKLVGMQLSNKKSEGPTGEWKSRAGGGCAGMCATSRAREGATAVLTGMAGRRWVACGAGGRDCRRGRHWSSLRLFGAMPHRPPEHMLLPLLLATKLLTGINGAPSPPATFDAPLLSYNCIVHTDCINRRRSRIIITILVSAPASSLLFLTASPPADPC